MTNIYNHSDYIKAKSFPTKDRPYLITVVIRDFFNVAVYIKAVADLPTSETMDVLERNIRQLDMSDFDPIYVGIPEISQYIRPSVPQSVTL